MDGHFLDRFQTHSRFQRFNQIAADGEASLAGGELAASKDSGVPTWQGAFTYQGTLFPYTMVGADPAEGGETVVGASLILLSFAFSGFTDADGQSIVIDSTGIGDDVLGSPNFVPFEYENGRAQFADAVQRASFAAKAGPDWHTTLGAPRSLTPVTIVVPDGLGEVVVQNGKLLGLVDIDFLDSELQTILQTDGIRSNEVALFVSHNVLSDQAFGYHSVVALPGRAERQIQTYLWSSWLDQDALGPVFADATTLTHEVSEWMADPFANNLVPNSTLPGSGSPPVCNELLEVGDAIEFLPNQMLPIELNQHVYHTQVEATLQWFTREAPSSAFKQAYSFPDRSVLQVPAEDCPTAGLGLLVSE